MAYPLSRLLSLRDFRVDSAAKTVRATEIALRNAETARILCEEALAAFRIWRAGEIERRYQRIMGQILTQDELDSFKLGLAALTGQELQKEAAVRDAGRALDEARAKVENARKAWRAADRDRQKILHHREDWQKADAREAAYREDLEMEEFKPVLFAAETSAED